MLAKQLKWLKPSLQVFLLAINSKRNNLSKLKIPALTQINRPVMLLMNVLGANQLQLKAHARLLKWLRPYPQAFLHVISSKRNHQSKLKIPVPMQINHPVML